MAKLDCFLGVAFNLGADQLAAIGGADQALQDQGVVAFQGCQGGCGALIACTQAAQKGSFCRYSSKGSPVVEAVGQLLGPVVA